MKPRIPVAKIPQPGFEPERVPEESISSGWERTWGNPASNCHLLGAQMVKSQLQAQWEIVRDWQRLAKALSFEDLSSVI